MSNFQLLEWQLYALTPFNPGLQIFLKELSNPGTPSFEFVNRQAKIVIIGITPGKVQLLNALREVKNRLCDGDSIETALTLAKQGGAFRD